MKRGFRKILAVSGGVDSMVMLDAMMATKRARDVAGSDEMGFFQENYASGDISGDDEYSRGDIIVAHFDHGIRENSGEDADFVQKISEKIYHVANIVEKGNLRGDISEEGARGARYEFLRKLMRQNEPAEIYTAHHLDDLLETVAINLLRGTGWRGLAALDAPGVRRPFLETEMFYEPLDKLAIYEYAAKKGLRFREDQSNSTDRYLRNRVRAKLEAEQWDYEQKLEIWQLWQRQKELRRAIDEIVTGMLPAAGEPWERKWFWKLEESAQKQHGENSKNINDGSAETWRLVAQELLRAGLLRAGVRATRPQIEDFRQAILTYEPGKKFNLPGDKLVKIGKTQFWLD